MATAFMILALLVCLALSKILVDACLPMAEQSPAMKLVLSKSMFVGK